MWHIKHTFDITLTRLNSLVCVVTINISCISTIHMQKPHMHWNPMSKGCQKKQVLGFRTQRKKELWLLFIFPFVRKDMPLWELLKSILILQVQEATNTAWWCHYKHINWRIFYDKILKKRSVEVSKELVWSWLCRPFKQRPRNIQLLCQQQLLWCCLPPVTAFIIADAILVSQDKSA